MPSRKIPSVEQETDELFNEDPYKPLSHWADEWECSHERVRQLREQCGFPPISSIDHGIARIVIDRLYTGEYSLTVRNLYDDLPIGLEKFMSWCKEDPAIWLGVLAAQQYIEEKSWNPDQKQCHKCAEMQPIENFGKTQKYKDGRQKICKNCIANPSGKLQEIQKRKEQLEKLRDKLDN